MLDMHLEPKIAFAQARWASLSDAERATHLRAAIAAKGSSKTKLAERLGLSWTTVHMWTIGENRVDWARWMAVAAALQLDETWEPAATEPAATAAAKPKARKKATPRAH